MGYLNKLIERNYPLKNLEKVSFGGYIMKRIHNEYRFYKTRKKTYFDSELITINFCRIWRENTELNIYAHRSGVFTNSTPLTMKDHELNDITDTFTKLFGNIRTRACCTLSKTEQLDQP